MGGYYVGVTLLVGNSHVPKVGHLGLAMLSGCLAEQASRSRHYNRV